MHKKLSNTPRATPTLGRLPHRLHRQAHPATLSRQTLRDLVAEMID